VVIPHRRRVGVLSGLTSVVAMVGLALLTGCAQLVPSIPTGSPSASSSVGAAASAGTLGSAGRTSAGPAPIVHVSPAAQALKQQLGVQIYWHTPGSAQQIAATAAPLLDYAVSLGANSVSLSFPIFTDGVHPTKVYTVAGSTPTPAELDVVIKAAQARGLRVMLRPLIDEANIVDSNGDWRGTIEPRSVSGWFAGYQTVLEPYLRLARSDSVDYFVIGAELDSLVGDRSQWKTLGQAAAEAFSGEIDYADNWSTWQEGGSYAPAANMGLDAYPDLDEPDSASVGKLTDAWEAWLEKRSDTTLKHTVMQEVGISATAGSYKHPAATVPAGKTVTPDPSIQANWFSAACAAAQSLDMPGIYFWSVDSNAHPAEGATSDVNTFIGRGDQAIKACFRTGWSG
jgi:hypothetical protein